MHQQHNIIMRTNYKIARNFTSLLLLKGVIFAKYSLALLTYSNIDS